MVSVTGALGLWVIALAFVACGSAGVPSHSQPGAGGEAVIAAGAPGAGEIGAGFAGESSPIKGGEAAGGVAGAAAVEGGAGAQGGEGGEAITARLLVIATDPAEASLDAEPHGAVMVQFSDLVNPSTVTGDTVLLRDVLLDELVPVALGVEGPIVSIEPRKRLGLVAEYEVVLDASIAGMAGLTLGQDFAFSFLVRDGEWHETSVSTDKMSPLGPTLGLDEDGTAFVSWVTRTETAYCPATVRRFSLDGGADAAFPLTETTTQSECRSPRASAAGSGIAATAWEEDTGVYVTQYRDGNWLTAPPLIEDYATDHISLATLPSGVVHLVAGSVNRVAARQTNETGEWSASAQTLSPDRPRSAAALAFDPEGNGFAVWRSSDTDLREMLLVSRFSKQSGAWSQVIKVPGSVAPQPPADSDDSTYFRGAPSVAINDGGQAVVLWVRGSELGTELYASHFADGDWDSPVKVSQELGGLVYGEAPALIAVGSDFLAAWTQAVKSGSATVNDTFSSRFGAAKGAWFEPERRSDGQTSGLRRMPRMGVDRHHNVLLIWPRTLSDASFELVQARYVHATATWHGPQPIGAATVTDELFDLAAPDNTYTLPGYGVGLPFAITSNGIAALAWANRPQGPTSEPQQDAKLGVFR